MIKTTNLKQAMEDMKNGTYNFTNNGKCSCCGSCCSNILPMSEKEIKAIKYYIKAHGIKEQKHFAPFAEPTADLTCPFLDNNKEKKCTIYDVRPQICREFICDPDKKLEIQSRMHGGNFKNVLVRETFYGNDNRRS